LTGAGAWETGGAVTQGAGVPDLPISIGACRFVDCLKNIHHPATSKISAAAPANRHKEGRRRGFSRNARAPFQV